MSRNRPLPLCGKTGSRQTVLRLLGNPAILPNGFPWLSVSLSWMVWLFRRLCFAFASSACESHAMPLKIEKLIQSGYSGQMILSWFDTSMKQIHSIYQFLTPKRFFISEHPYPFVSVLRGPLPLSRSRLRGWRRKAEAKA